MQQIKVIESSDAISFEDQVNEELKRGYKVLSGSCGFVNSEEYDFCSSFQAILINSCAEFINLNGGSEEEGEQCVKRMMI